MSNKQNKYRADYSCGGYKYFNRSDDATALEYAHDIEHEKSILVQLVLVDEDNKEMEVIY